MSTVSPGPSSPSSTSLSLHDAIDSIKPLSDTFQESSIAESSNSNQQGQTKPISIRTQIEIPQVKSTTNSSTVFEYNSSDTSLTNPVKTSTLFKDDTDISSLLLINQPSGTSLQQKLQKGLKLEPHISSVAFEPSQEKLQQLNSNSQGIDLLSSDFHSELGDQLPQSVSSLSNIETTGNDFSVFHNIEQDDIETLVKGLPDLVQQEIEDVNNLGHLKNSRNLKDTKDLRNGKTEIEEIYDSKSIVLPEIDKSMMDQTFIDSLALTSSTPLEEIDFSKVRDKDILDSIPFDLILPESLQNSKPSKSGSIPDTITNSDNLTNMFFNASSKSIVSSLVSSTSLPSVLNLGNDSKVNNVSQGDRKTDISSQFTSFTDYSDNNTFTIPKSHQIRAQSETLETAVQKPILQSHSASVPHSPTFFQSSLPLDIPTGELSSLSLSAPLNEDLQQQFTQSNYTTPVIIPTDDLNTNFYAQSTLFPRSNADKSSTLQAINALNNGSNDNLHHSDINQLNKEPDSAPRVSAYARLDFPSFTFYVQTLQVILGRGAETGGSMVDVDLGSVKAISRKHAKIFYNFGTQRFELSILGRNGAFVDDEFIETGSTVPLRDGYVFYSLLFLLYFLINDCLQY